MLLQFVSISRGLLGYTPDKSGQVRSDLEEGFGAPIAKAGRPEQVEDSRPFQRNRRVVEELKRGDRSGCSRLLEMYQDRLLGEAVNVFHLRREDAEELVNDVLLKIVRQIHDFQFRKSDGDFHFWVMAIFKNAMRDVVRRQALLGCLVESFEDSPREAEDGDSRTGMLLTRAIIREYEASLGDGRSAETSKRLESIADVLDMMEPWERVLLRCRALDVPYGEIASYTGKAAAQLKVYHARVKKKFIILVKQHYPEFEAYETRSG